MAWRSRTVRHALRRRRVERSACAVEAGRFIGSGAPARACANDNGACGA